MRNYIYFEKLLILWDLNRQKYYDMYVHLTIYETTVEIWLKYCALHRINFVTYKQKNVKCFTAYETNIMTI